MVTTSMFQEDKVLLVGNIGDADAGFANRLAILINHEGNRMCGLVVRLHQSLCITNA